MQNEVKFSRYAETGKYVSDIDLEEFIKLYVNHRPVFDFSKQDLYKAFQVLGVPDDTGEPVIPREELLELLQARGRLQLYHITHYFVYYCCHAGQERQGAFSISLLNKESARGVMQSQYRNRFG